MRRQNVTRLLLLAFAVAAPLYASGPGPAVVADAERVSWGTGVGYTYDGSGNVITIGTQKYYYDSAGRLVYSTNPEGGATGYAYDAFGNRKSCTPPEGGSCQAGLTVNSANNRLSAPVAYDASGRVTAFQGHTFAYDALDMPHRDTFGGTTEYVYTADDERIAVVAPTGQWDWSVRGPSGKVIREFTSTGTNFQWRKDYIWRGDLLLATRQLEPNGTVTTYHYHLDHLGTPRRITDDADRIVGKSDYDPFGSRLSGGTNPASANRMQFTGHERDTGPLGEQTDTLDYMHARYYSPYAGRFLSVDPARSSAELPKPQTWNRYSYAINNPIAYTDPTGKAPYKGGTMDPAKLLQEVEWLEEIGMDKRALFNKISKNHEGETDRYFYTEKYGWVDIRHFGAMAAAAAFWPDPVVSFVGGAEEWRQWLSEWGDDYRSGRSPEDGPSNDAGIEFGDEYLMKNATATEALRQWLKQSGALPPDDPRAGRENLPDTDPSKRESDPDKRWWQFWK